MGQVISKEVKLIELYKYALTQALQTNFIIPEVILDDIHLKIINELKLKCKPLVEQGIISEEDISTKLDNEVTSLLEDAKKENLKRVFTLVSENDKLNNGEYIYRSVNGQDNYKIVSSIREWLSQSNDSFSDISECFKHKLLDDIEDQLKLKSLFPNIIEQRVILGKTKTVEANLPEPDTYVLTLKIGLQIHEFNFSKPTEYTTLKTDTLNCFIDNDNGIKKLVYGSGNFAFCFPVCEKCEVDVRLNADVVFNVTQEIQPTFPLFDSGQKLEKQFVHRVCLDMKMPDSNIKLMKRIIIKTTEEKLAHFNHLYAHFKEIVSSKGKQSTSALPGASFLSMYCRYPWLEFVETLRKGGISAAMEIIKKKSDMIRSLLNNENIVLGVAFEELQIAKILAEIKKRNIPVKVIQGDGRGSLKYMNKVIKTPEYTDDVLNNMETGELFGIQFKFSTNGKNLARNIKIWENKWNSKNQRNGTNFPEELNLNNIKVIGPTDVMEDSSFSTISNEIRHHVELEVPSWAKHPIDEKETVKSFLYDNKPLLEKVIASKEFEQWKLLSTEIRKDIKDIEKCVKEKKQVEKTLKALVCQRDAAKQRRESTQRWENGIKANNRLIETLDDTLNRNKSSLQQNRNKMKAAEDKMRSDIHQNIDTTYKNQYCKSTAWKEVHLNIAIQAVTDGIVALICTSGNEFEKFQKNEISFGELIKKVTYETVIASAKGAVLASIPSALQLAATYATIYKSFPFTTASKFAFPMYTVLVILNQSYSFLNHWWKGDITTAEMEKSFVHFLTSIGLNLLGGIGSSFIGGPMGLFIGAAFAIVVNVGDYFLGDNVFFKDDKGEQSLESKEKNITKLKDDVLCAAYDLFGLTEQASMEEVKEKYKAAVLKYHPDKGGDNESFCAVRASYLFICEAKGFYTDKDDYYKT
ncbi:DNAJA2 [Mytilus coruscus]|uniref:DNAJA2 n=1 Tax=Mytilus coruscus TaxID=42192 RepID=A0A6J8B398_MYTCO|nr:DNAJA2 [Mytilus coruscus]